jgi:hypothetical protein
MASSRIDAYTEMVGDALAWMRSEAYFTTAHRALEERIRRPLLARGIPVGA